MSIRTSIFLSTIAASSLAVSALAGCSMDSKAGPNNNGVAPLLADTTDVPPDQNAGTCPQECAYEGETGTYESGEEWVCVDIDCEPSAQTDTAADAVEFLMAEPPKLKGKARRKTFARPDGCYSGPVFGGLAFWKNIDQCGKHRQWDEDSNDREGQCAEFSQKYTAEIRFECTCEGSCSKKKQVITVGKDAKVGCAWDPHSNTCEAVKPPYNTSTVQLACDVICAGYKK